MKIHRVIAHKNAKNTDFFQKLQIFHLNIDIFISTKEEKLEIIIFDTLYVNYIKV